jgi:8-amino-3,8-dideoxy-alpha-D-manno-octulosonate transaminase
VVGDIRNNARRVYEGIGDLPGLSHRRLPDPAGELGSGIFLGFKSKETRDRYLAALKAENVPAGPPGGSVLLPTQPHVENKLTLHPAWPSFTSQRGKAVQYGAACCPRTIDLLNRFAGVPIDPKFSKRDIDDIVAAVRKVYPVVVKA